MMGRDRDGPPGERTPGPAEPGDAAPRERAAAPAGPGQDGLGAQLKAVYDEVVRQPLPDRLMSLLADLEAREKRGA